MRRSWFKQTARLAERQTSICAAVIFSVSATSGCAHRRISTSAPPPPPSVPLPAAPASGGHAGIPAVGVPVSSEVGLASWYGPPYHNRQAADGSVFDQNAMTAAHRTLPLGTTVRVTNLQTHQVVEVRITDRGPFVPNRILDLSLAAAKAAGVYQAGIASVQVEAFENPAADPAGKWCVQIGAFLTMDDATQVRNDLRRRQAAAKVIAFAGPTGFWVRINPANPGRSQAKTILDSIHVPDADAYLVRTD